MLLLKRLPKDPSERVFRGAPERQRVEVSDDGWPAVTLDEKGDEEPQMYAHAVALTERALAVPGLLRGTERAKMLLELAELLDMVGRRVREEEVAREAERLADAAGDTELRGSAALALGAVLRFTRLDEAEAACLRAREIAQARGDRKAAAAATRGLGAGAFSRGRLAEARQHFEQYVAFSRDVGDKEAEAPETANLGLVLFSQGRLADSHTHFERSLALSREIGARRSEAVANGHLGGFFCSQGRLAEAREHFERYLAFSREIGDRRSQINATGGRGDVLLSQGRLAAARAHYERSLALSREIGYRRSEAMALRLLGELMREEGSGHGGEEPLLASLALSEEIGLRHLSAQSHLALGLLRAAGSGDDGDDGGRASLIAARDLAAEVGAPGVETLARCALAQSAGDALDAPDAQDALAAFTRNEERLEAGERLRARHLLWKATGDSAHLAEAKRLLDESVAHVDNETRGSMLANLRVNREIMARWDEHGGDGNAG